ncbi:MAG: L-fucose/L-arabinose isomerase family protein [Verrucomicrobiia bacterium]
MSKPTTFGVILGTRGFFPTELCREGREQALAALKGQGFEAIALTPEDSPHGSIESLAEARKCADLFRKHRDRIDGILVFLPNFGDERAIANAIRWAELGVPVLLQAFPDDATKMTIAHRRDSFCGKMSAANNLRQYGIPFSLTTDHTSAPHSESFLRDLRRFAATCRVVRGFKHARVGAIGARPGAFNTVRYSEKLLERSGISVEVIDLFEVLGMVGRLKDGDPAVHAKLDAIRAYVSTKGIPEAALLKMAKLGVVIDRWMQEKQLVGSAIQCWTALQEFFGVVPCTLMSMMSHSLLPSACEVDIAGMLGMYALQLASGRSAAIVDWNNNFGGETDKCVVFHCSNLPKDIFSEVRMDFQEIIAGSVGKENTYGTIVGPIAPGPMSFCRISTDDLRGRVSTYVGEGDFTDDKIKTFGGYGVLHVKGLQGLLRWCCRNGFEHHVAISRGHVAEGIADAFGTYLGWECRHHGADA